MARQSDGHLEEGAKPFLRRNTMVYTHYSHECHEVLIYIAPLDFAFQNKGTVSCSSTLVSGVHVLLSTESKA